MIESDVLNLRSLVKLVGLGTLGLLLLDLIENRSLGPFSFFGQIRQLRLDLDRISGVAFGDEASPGADIANDYIARGDGQHSILQADSLTRGGLAGDGDVGLIDVQPTALAALIGRQINDSGDFKDNNAVGLAHRIRQTPRAGSIQVGDAIDAAKTPTDGVRPRT